MKIWHSYGTEHSMNLVMIGRFKTEDAADKAEQTIKTLQEKLPELVSTDERSPRRFSDEVSKLMHEHDVYIFHPSELQHFLYEVNVQREGDTLRLWTDETEVSGFIKVLIEGGAKVEVFSKHDHPEEGDNAK